MLTEAQLIERIRLRFKTILAEIAAQEADLRSLANGAKAASRLPQANAALVLDGVFGEVTGRIKHGRGEAQVSLPALADPAVL